MRLTCPECQAQYEVPDDVIPLEGRDVQCSNCSAGWYQEHPLGEVKSASGPDHPEHEPHTGGTEPQEKETAPPVAAESRTPRTSETTQSEVQTPSLPEVLQASDKPVARGDPPSPGDTYPSEDIAPGPTTADDTAHGDKDHRAESPAPKRRALDPAVADVLRAEAELEARARRNETAGAFESQPELGLDDNLGNDDALAGLRHAEPSPESVEELLVARPANIRQGRDLLPDIEEINSTLRSSSDRDPYLDAGQTAQVDRRETRSTRAGFFTVLALIAACIAVYAYASEISIALPVAEPWMTAYVAAVDAGRIWLDTKIMAGLAWIEKAAGIPQGS